MPKKVIDIVRKESKPKEAPKKEPVIREQDVAPKKSALVELLQAPKEVIKEALPEVTKEEPEKIEQKVESFEKAEITRFQREDGFKKKKRFSLKTYLLLFLFLFVLGAFTYAALAFLPRVNIKITTKKTDWNSVEAVTAAKDIGDPEAGAKLIPAEIFRETKNFNFSFAATGKKYVEKKARGTITIYNTYSSAPQPLVATTRFATPDGKIFRLEKGVTVPGAKIEGGKIIASSITAVVLAEKAGPAYNLGPIPRFSIPGLSSDAAKFKAIYAESKEPMQDGFVGELTYPTDDDIKKGREEASKGLKDTIDSFLSLQIPPAFKIIDGSKQFRIIKEQVTSDVDEKGNFGFYMEAESMVIAFRESDILDLMKNLAKGALGDSFEVKDYKIEYGAGRPDFGNGKISFAVNFGGRFSQPVNVDDFRQKVLKQKEQDLKTSVFSLPGVEKATISFWPFWVKSAPNDLKRITVEVE